jgi:hypothetical protein
MRGLPNTSTLDWNGSKRELGMKPDPSISPTNNAEQFRALLSFGIVPWVANLRSSASDTISWFDSLAATNGLVASLPSWSIDGRWIYFRSGTKEDEGGLYRVSSRRRNTIPGSSRARPTTLPPASRITRHPNRLGKRVSGTCGTWPKSTAPQAFHPSPRRSALRLSDERNDPLASLNGRGPRRGERVTRGRGGSALEEVARHVFGTAEFDVQSCLLSTAAL